MVMVIRENLLSVREQLADGSIINKQSNWIMECQINVPERNLFRSRVDAIWWSGMIFFEK